MRLKRTTSYENVRCFSIFDLTPAPPGRRGVRLKRIERGFAPLLYTPKVSSRGGEASLDLFPFPPERGHRGWV
jgi:hypothetical protein